VYKLPDGEYCAYLRKSRADLEAESRGEGDTYARHIKILLELARRHNITLTKIYQEKPATSGERISERPEMIRLLEDIEDGLWTGVLVVEVERLARGDTLDQGIVAQTFKYSNTLIITPMRVYDPSRPEDEEYFEFGLFMSRREFKTINRRLQTGRITSVKEGKYVGNKPPYGYIRVKLDNGKGYTLEPHPEQAPVVKMIFSLYTDPDPNRRMGTALIARYLNEKKIPTQRNKQWTVATVNGILRNPVYIGYVRWGSRPVAKKKNTKSRPRKPIEEWTLAKGLHEPIIDEVTFRRAQQIMQQNSHPPVDPKKISNPFAGLVKCAFCGSAMILRPYNDKRPPGIICSRQGCKNVSSMFHIFEERVLEALKDWLEEYKSQWLQIRPEEKKHDRLEVLRNVLRAHEKSLKELEVQKDSLHDLVERKVYTIEDFIERSQKLAKRFEEVNEAIRQVKEEIENEVQFRASQDEFIPQVEHVLDIYHKTEDPALKNELLKSVIEQIVYRKDKRGHWKTGGMDNFEISLFPRVPKQINISTS